jgi:hypothetical protein
VFIGSTQIRRGRFNVGRPVLTRTQSQEAVRRVDHPRGIGAVSPSVISAVSVGAHPSNSAATAADAAAASVKSMSATHSAERLSSTYVCRTSAASPWATIPFPG